MGGLDTASPRRADPAYLTATQKIWKARHINEALAWLEPRGLLHVAGGRTVAEQLAQLPGQALTCEDRSMIIRAARMEDAAEASRVLVASIAELCSPDHGGNADNIARWTANKTPERLASWIASPASHVFVAEEAGRIFCVGAFGEEGEIQLNYVDPGARFRGMSRAMLARLEDEMRRRGIRRGHLTSTATAHRFYRAAGWEDAGGPEEMFGLDTGHAMTKVLLK